MNYQKFREVTFDIMPPRQREMNYVKAMFLFLPRCKQLWL